jgi:WXXGXW repeat (2 copies)
MNIPPSIRSYALLAGLTLAGVGFSSGCVVAVRPAPVAAVYTEPAEVVVNEAPPAPLAEVVTVAPGPGYLWIGGYYHWYGGRWVWYRGHYERPPRAGMHWIAARYEFRGGARVYIAGHWR